MNLVNWPDLNKVLKTEVFIHSDGQLRATPIILDYNPISSNFQAPKYVIKARDPRLHQINVAVPGFLVTSPVLEGVLQVELPSRSATEVEATSSQLIIKEEEEEEIVEVSYFEDDFEVFNQFEAPEVLAGDFSHLLSVQVNHNQEATDIPKAMGI